MAIIDEVQIGNHGRVSSKFLVRARFFGPILILNSYFLGTIYNSTKSLYSASTGQHDVNPLISLRVEKNNSLKQTYKRFRLHIEAAIVAIGTCVE